MKEIEVKDWADFTAEIEKIKAEFAEYTLDGIRHTNRIIYRGQADSEWRLESTLERFSSSQWSVRNYAELALLCAPQIESFTDRIWNLPDITEIERQIAEGEKLFQVNIPCYEFWVYLRHHGFPSPLLDWTMSPYLAAFFAFHQRIASEKTTVFAFIEMPQGTKGGWGGEPQVNVLGPYAKTHKRHFLQQSWYTVCTKDQGKSPVFECHEKVFERNDPDQDLLFKIMIPRSERLKALSILHEVNISHFSLFQSEESLMSTLAFREIEMMNL